MISTSPRLPELSFFQESLNPRLQTTSNSFDEHTSPHELSSSSQIDIHRKQLPSDPINSMNESPARHKAKQSKRSNPLVDLVETEETYVTLLSAIIRKVAAAWSKTNFPPKELDAMFRGIESIFKANRRLLSQLKEIDQTPSNPNSAKALGDLLMNWIIDLDKPYTKFCNSYATGFDSWTPIASNTILPSILHTLTAELPPDPLGSRTSSWSLDLLFALPRSRLKYYRKLYARLLKSTEAGRSDHTLLTSAIEKLDILLNILLQRSDIAVHNGDQRTQITHTSGHVERDDRLPIGNETPNSNLPSSPMSGSSASHTPLDQPLISPTNPITTVSELEQNLSTNDVLDLFTLNPRPVQLQLNSPSLPFTRTIRYSGDVDIRFAPKATPENVQSHPRGYLFLLTDLMLLCERASFEANNIRLLYPPLAGKHLRVLETSDEDTVLQITILKKETIVLRLKSKVDRDHLLKHFKKCIESGATVTPSRDQSPPPPVPALKPVMSEVNSPSKQVSSREERTFSQEFDPLTPDLANEIPIGRLSIDRPPDDIRFVSQENKDISFRNNPDSAMNTRASFVQTPTFQTEFAQVQNLPTYASAPIIPPPRGASSAYHLSPHPQSSGPYTHTLPGHLQTNVTLHQRSLTPSLPPLTGQQPDWVYDNPMLRKSVSTTSLSDTHYQPSRTSLHSHDHLPGLYPVAGRPEMYQRQSRDSLPPHAHQSRRSSITMNSWSSPPYDNNTNQEEVEDTHQFSGPTTSKITAEFKCKVFLKLQHGQWKNLGSAKLKLYVLQPANVKQLVVESESKDRAVLISTIVLTDGVERVGKTGVAIELSDKGSRTGIIYMIQLRNETSASGLFDSLLAGSDRAAGRRMS